MNSITTVFYDGLCPICVDAVEHCRQLLHSHPIHWFDISDQQRYLNQLGIDPTEALIELHLLTADGRILKGIDSYSYLLRMMSDWHYRLMGLALQITPVKLVISAYYRWSTIRRLRKSRRYPQCARCTGSVS